MTFYVPPDWVIQMQSRLSRRSAVNPRMVYLNGDYFVVEFEQDGRILHTSPMLDESQLQKYVVGLRVHSTRALRMKLTIRRYRDGRCSTTSVRTRYSVVQFSSGLYYISPVAQGVALSRSTGDLRSRVRRPVSDLTRYKHVHSSTRAVRPSPEQEYLSNFPWYEVADGEVRVNTVSRTWPTYYRTWSGVRTPGFGSLKRGSLPENPHSVYFFRSSDLGFSMNELWRADTPPYTPSTRFKFCSMANMFGVGSTQPIPVNHYEAAATKALARLHKKAGNEIEGNLAQDLVQFNQLTSMIGTTVMRITKSVSALRRGNIPAAVASLWQGSAPRFRRGGGPNRGGSLANNWLELQYGWKPLLQDIDGACSSLAKYLYETDAIRTTRSSATVEDVIISPNWHPAFHTQQVGETVLYVRSTCTYKMRYQIGDNLRAFLAQTGFSNPINLMWEILPYSFVVDWFLPIGQFLETLSSWDGLVFVDGVRTRFTKGLGYAAVRYEGSAPGAPYAYECSLDGSYTSEEIRLDREVLTSFPTGPTPTVKMGLSSMHTLNAIALLKQAFARR